MTSFHSSALPPEQLNSIMTDYLAVERARIFRQLFVMRFGALAIIMGVVGLLWLSLLASSVGVALCLLPPACAWTIEFRRERRLARRLQGIPGTTTVAADGQAHQ